MEMILFVSHHVKNSCSVILPKDREDPTCMSSLLYVRDKGWLYVSRSTIDYLGEEDDHACGPSAGHANLVFLGPSISANMALAPF